MFCLISYNLRGKWNLDIDFFKVLTYSNFPDFGISDRIPGIAIGKNNS